MLIPLSILAIIKAPISAPTIFPFPPIKLVPPITHAAIASSSYILPALTVAAFNLLVKRTPATPARPPIVIKTHSVFRLILIPDNAAASWFPPIA